MSGILKLGTAVSNWSHGLIFGNTKTNSSNSDVNPTPRTPKVKVTQDNNDEWIQIINSVQNKIALSGYSLDISLPQIVVVGCQSAGKSSVLESIVGKEFLPRGNEVVTRRPTIIQLVRANSVYAVFAHIPDRKFLNFNEVKEEIERETFRLLGPKGFSSEPISLQIFTPNALNLTLVDLPGLIRVAENNQSEDCKREVKNMVLKYIEQPNSLILAVTPANQDITDSAALKIARNVDPEKIRTIGILTKLDLMDKGTDARAILKNEKVHLQRGFIGVVNRSQEDIIKGKDIATCLKDEREFFLSKPCYKDMKDRMGIPYLRKFLHKQLYEHIKERLPSVRNELFQKLLTLQNELNESNSQFGSRLNPNPSIQSCIIKLVQQFVDKIQAEIFSCSDPILDEELASGALINYQLCIFQRNLKRPVIPVEKELIFSIASLCGFRNSISIPNEALEMISKRLFIQYKDPLNNLVDSIAGSLLSSVRKFEYIMDSYPNLKKEVVGITCKYINESVFATKDLIGKHLNATMYFVNTHHPDFQFPKFDNTENLLPLNLWEEHGGAEKTSNDSSSDSSNDSSNDSSDDQSETESGSKEDLDAAKTISSNPCAQGNARYLTKIIERNIKVQMKIIGDTAITYVTYYLVKAVMDFTKEDLIPLAVDFSDQECIKKEWEKDFSKIKKMKDMVKCFEEALDAIRNF